VSDFNLIIWHTAVNNAANIQCRSFQQRAATVSYDSITSIDPSAVLFVESVRPRPRCPSVRPTVGSWHRWRVFVSLSRGDTRDFDANRSGFSLPGNRRSARDTASVMTERATAQSALPAAVAAAAAAAAGPSLPTISRLTGCRRLGKLSPGSISRRRKLR